MIYSAIYKDNYYNYSTTGDTLDYYLQDNEMKKIYVGRAYKAPSANTISINVTKIINNYLFNEMPLDFSSITGDTIEHYYANRIFTLYNATTEEILEQYNFLYCYDWLTNFNGQEKVVLSNPINGHLDSRMKVLFTEYNNEADLIDFNYD